MDFVTIDFETAGVYRDSACEIGLTFVENNKITETRSWLIKPNCWPNFNPYTVDVHGIHPEDVSDAPDFAELWPEIKPLINGQKLIAHNASFDFGVLRESLNTYELDYPELEYACSYIFSKKAWPNQYSYALNYLCRINGIKFKHHRAAADSRATAELSLIAFREFNIETFEDLSNILLTRIGSMSQGIHSPCRTKRDYSKKANRI